MTTDKLTQHKLHEMIRVNHAGELGAQWIYEGQLKVVKSPELKATLQKLKAEEQVHLNYFEQEMKTRRVRPSALYPLWKWGGRALGAITALAGEKYAMACTEAVEEVITSHYTEQLNYLNLMAPEEHKLLSAIQKFKEDEERHHDFAQEQQPPETLPLKAAKKAISLITKAAVSIAKQI